MLAQFLFYAIWHINAIDIYGPWYYIEVINIKKSDKLHKLSLFLCLYIMVSYFTELIHVAMSLSTSGDMVSSIFAYSFTVPIVQC